MIIGIAVEVDEKGAVQKFTQLAGGALAAGAAADKAKGSFSGMSSVLQGIGQGIGQKLFAGLEGALSSIPAALGRSLDFADGLSDTAVQFGVLEGAMERYSVAARGTTAGTEQIGAGIMKLQKNLGEGSEATSRTLDAIGLSLKSLEGQAPDKQFDAVLGAIAKIPDPAQRTAVAMELLGKSGAALIPMAQNLEHVRDSALLMGQDGVKGLADLADEMEGLQGAAGATWDQIAAGVGQSEALHVFLTGLSDVLVQLAQVFKDNRAQIADFVTMLVRGLASTLTTVVGLVSYAVDAWTGFRIMLAGVQAGIEVLTGGFLALWAVLSGDASLGEARKMIQDSAAMAQARFNAEADAAMAQNKNLQGVATKVQEVFAGLERTTYAVGNAHHGAGAAAEQHGAKLRGLGAAGEAAAKAQEKLGQLMKQASSELAQAETAGQGGLDEAFGKVDKHIEDLMAKIPKGLDPKEVEPFLQTLQRLSEQLKTNAFEAERQKVLGETYQDVEKKASNLLAVVGEFERRGGKLSDLTQPALEKLAADLQAVAAKSPAARAALQEVWAAFDQGNVRVGRGFFMGPEAAQEAERIKHQLEDQGRIEKEQAVERENALERYRAAWAQVYDTALGVADLAGMLGFEGLAATLGDAVGWMEQFDKAAEDGVLSWGEIASLVAGLGAAFQRATDSASGFSRALNTALLGASVGGKLGEAFGGPIGKAIGASIGAVVGGVVGLFHKPGWVKAGEEAGRILGFGVSKELAKAIEKTAKELHIDFRGATLLNLDKAIEESGKGAGAFTGQMQDLVRAIASGAVPAKQGLEALGRSFSMLTAEAKKSKLASLDVFKVLQTARQAGVMSEEMKAWVAEAVEAQVAAAKDAFGKIDEKTGFVTGGIKFVDEKAARDQATIFAMVWNQTVAEKGLMEAARALQPALDAIIDQLEDTGFGEAVKGVFGPIWQQYALSGNEAFAGAADGAMKFAEILKQSINGAMPMVLEQFQAFEGVATSAFDQARQAALDQGLTTEQANTQALQAIAPLLQQLVQAASAYGFELDAGTQALLEQARAAGVAFPTSPVDRMVGAVERLVDVLGKAFGVSTALGESFDNYNLPTPGSVTPRMPGSTVPSYAGGGIHRGPSSGSWALLHGTEAVMSLPQLYGELGGVVASATAGHLWGLMQSAGNASATGIGTAPWAQPLGLDGAGALQPVAGTTTVLVQGTYAPQVTVHGAGNQAEMEAFLRQSLRDNRQGFEDRMRQLAREAVGQ